jgi:O-antigen/teichoic acid export membrane protein
VQVGLFLLGKALSALLTLIILLALVRLLPVEDYSAYVTFVAATELAIAVSLIGLPWLAARSLPEFRLHGSPRLLAGLCWQLLGFNLLAVSVFTLLFAALVDIYLGWLGFSKYLAAAHIYLLIIVAEAIGRFTRNDLLGALLQQGIAQTSQVLKSLIFLVVLGVLNIGGSLTLTNVAWAELASACLATLLSLAGLSRYLAKLKSQPLTQAWTAPSIWHLWPTALKMYASQLLTFANSQQIILNMIQIMLGPRAAATYGFLRNLYEMISSYLPATLLLGLVKPKLISSYLRAKNVAELARNANLAGKLSLIVLIPVVAFATAGGESLVTLLSGGKFQDTGLLFCGLILALIPQSQKQILETVAVTTGYAGLCTQASLAVLAIPPLVWLMLDSGVGLWSGVIGVGLGHLVFVLFVSYGVRIRTGYHTDQIGLMRLATAGLAGVVSANFAPTVSSTVLTLVLMGVGVMFGYSLVLWLLNPFTGDERIKILSFLHR